MAICYTDLSPLDLPPEERLLDEVTLRLIDEAADSAESETFGQLVKDHHYLHSDPAVGEVLRYVAEYRGQWVGLLTFCSAAFHLKPRDKFLHWSAREVTQRRHLVAQNSRFLVLPSTGRWPNLASRVLKLVGERLSSDWQQRFGHPVLLVETFVDPQRYRGTCYKAAGWEALGGTQGFQRRSQDFYTDTKHPKELWVRPLGPTALETLRAAELPPALTETVVALPPPPTLSTEQMASLWELVRVDVPEFRKPQGLRHPLASVLCLATLAVAAGCQGPEAIAAFAQSLNHGQRRRLHCRARDGTQRQYDVPCQRTFERILKALPNDQLVGLLARWMAAQDPQPVTVLHLDGKVIHRADPAPPRLAQDPDLAAAAAAIDTPADQQKPNAEKALTLVNFQTPGQRLIDQIAVPQDTNEEAAVAAHLPKMDLRGVTVIADAAHTVKANCRQLTQQQGADYIFFLKGNQPNALAKAQQLLSGSFSPSGPNDRQGTRPGGAAEFG